MSTAERFAVRVVRAWAHLYTSRIPGGLRLTRRAEIDSDLWHHAKDKQDHGASPLVTALEILMRTLFGVPDDLSWCFEVRQQQSCSSQRRRRFPMEFSARQARWMGIASITGFAVVLLMFVLVPTLTSYFASAAIPLPLPTRIVMGMSAFLMANWWACVLAGVAIFFGLVRVDRSLRKTILVRVGVLHDDVDSATEAVLTKLEPIMIVGLGVVVGAMVLAMFLPIFDVVSAMK